MKSDQIKQVLYKKKGLDIIGDTLVLEQRIINQFINTNQSHYFIDWDELTVSEEVGSEVTIMPDWKSYIIMSFNSEKQRWYISDFSKN